MRINKHDTNGTKPLLGKGELGYDDYTAGGDTGRVYVGNGSANIAMAKKAEVTTVDGKVETHTARADNPHSVTKAQVGLGNVQDVDTTNASNITSGTLANARLANSGVTAGTYKSVTVDGKGMVTGGTNPTTLGGYGITDAYTKTEVNSLIPTTLPASDVYAWAKVATKPTYTASEVGLGNVNNTRDLDKPISAVTQIALNTTVKLTGDQTIAGVKTFSSSIVGNITGNAGSATIAADSNKLIGKNWHWSGQDGQPTWLWGGSDDDNTNMYIYNPANFNVNYANTAGVANNAIGYGQTWQDVTASRVLGTTYTNSTGKPIMVFVTKNNVTNSTWNFYINGVSIGSINGYGTQNSTSTIIPNGSTYMADTLAGILIKWVELR